MNTVYVIGGVIIFIWFVHGIYKSLLCRKRVLHIITENCTGCKRCIKKCRHKALDFINDKNKTNIVVNPNKCTCCGKCIKVCKFHALEFAERKKS
ncbi:MAG: 4Fe-4S binding protein [Planctomycetaceae bacterium]|nr:4Fe-4S binding protein [Planctomycetaceae bacterium]